MGDDVLSTRDALSAAWDEAEKQDEEELESAGGDEGEETGGSDENSEESVRAEGEEEERGEEGEEDEDKGKEKDGDEEGSDGGDAKKKYDGDDDEGKDKDKQSLEPDKPLEKAPVSWKPGIREHWKGLPKEVKAEIHRRETEIQQGLQQAAGHKKLAQEYYQTVQPFAHLIQAQNSTPAQAITSLMTTAARLTMGSPIEKAKVVGEIIKNYGVDIRALDEHLSGQQPSGDSETSSAIQAALQKELKPFQDFMGRFNHQEQMRAQQVNEQVASDIQRFAEDPKNEFFEDVREDMADLMEMAWKRQQPMTIQQAYDRACWSNPDIAKVLQQREESARTKERQKELEKKKAASSSLEAGGGGERKKAEREAHDLRGSISDAWDALETGQRI